MTPAHRPRRIHGRRPGLEASRLEWALSRHDDDEAEQHREERCAPEKWGGFRVDQTFIIDIIDIIDIIGIIGNADADGDREEVLGF